MTSANEIIKEFDSEESENKIRITNVIINANVTNDENLRYEVDWATNEILFVGEHMKVSWKVVEKIVWVCIETTQQ